MICIPCREGRPDECANRVNADGTLRELPEGVTPTWCDNQYRETSEVKGPDGRIYTAPPGVTTVVNR